MRKYITIQIPRPNLEGLSKDEKKLLVEEMSKDIVEQIIRQEELRLQDETIKFWQMKMIEWQIEDTMNEIKYANKDE